MDYQLKIGEEVLQKFFPAAPAMRIVKINIDGTIICRYEKLGKYMADTFEPAELMAGFVEVVNQQIVKGDYVRHKAFASSPIMFVIKDYNNEVLFGCRYISNGVFHYAEFLDHELELVEEEEVEQYLGQSLQASY